MKPDELKVNLATVMMRIINDHPFDDDYGLISCEEGVDLMPSSIELSGIENQMMSVMSREFVLKTYVDQMRPHYDYILIDCTPSLNMLPVNAFVAADSIIVPSQPRILSTKGLDLLMNSYRKVQKACTRRYKPFAFSEISVFLATAFCTAVNPLFFLNCPSLMLSP